MSITNRIIAAGLAIAASAAAAQASPDFGDITTEVMSTDAPAFAALGVDGKEINTPEALKAAGVSFLNGIDGDGRYQTGLAVQFSPFVLFAPRSVPYSRYRDDWGTRALANLFVTGALTVGVADSANKPSRGAVGLVWKPYDSRDPFANKALFRCIDGLRKGPITPVGVPGRIPGESDPTVGAEDGVPDPVYQAEAKRCRTTHDIPDSRGFAVQFGLASTFASLSGKLNDFEAKGVAASATMLFGLDPILNPAATKDKVGGKLLLGTIYRSNETVGIPGSTGQFVDRDRWSVGGRLLIGRDTAWMLGGEVLYQSARYQALGKDEFITWNVTFDLRISKNLWATASYGDTSGSNFGKSAQFVSGLRFAFGPDGSLGSK